MVDNTETLPAVFITSCCLCAIGLLLTAAFLAFNLKFKNIRVIKMSSPNLNTVTCCGAMVAYVSCVTWGIDILVYNGTSSHSFCQVRPWMTSSAFTLMFGTLLAKSWRIKKIFQEAPVKRVIIKDKVLFGLVFSLVAVDVILLACWQSLDPLTRWQPSVKQNYINASDVLTSSDTVVVTHQLCTSENALYWLVAIYLYKLLLMLSTCYMAWSVRGITIPAMNESSSVVVACIFTAIVGSVTTAICSILQHKGPDDANACALTGIFVCTTVTLFLVFVPKIRQMHVWYRLKKKQSLKMYISAQMTPASTSEEHLQEEFYHLLAENESLKKSLAQKEATLSDLRSNISQTQEELLLYKNSSPLSLGRSECSFQRDIESLEGAGGISIAVPEQDGSFLNYGGQFSKCELESVVEDLNQRSDIRYLQDEQSPNNSFRIHSKTCSAAFKRSYSRSPIAPNTDQNSVGELNVSNLSAVSMYNKTCPGRTSPSLSHNLLQTKHLAGSIVGSYRLDNTTETYSYLKDYLIKMSDDTNLKRDFETRRSRSESHDSVFTLGNDEYYPPTTRDTDGVKPSQKRNNKKSGNRTLRRTCTLEPGFFSVVNEANFKLTLHLNDIGSTFV